MPENGPPPPPPPPRRSSGGPKGQPSGSGSPLEGGWPKWMIWVLAGVVVVVIGLYAFGSTSSGKDISYSSFMRDVQSGKVDTVKFNNANGHITGTYSNGSEFATTGLLDFPEQDLATLRKHDVKFSTTTPSENSLWTLLPYLLMFALPVVLIIWFMRRSSGQMGGIMNVGRSKAKTYDSDSPRTTFADVAGYEGVKTEIREVVDFLKHPEQFARIGARIPKGVLLVGPPGTGKTLLARAVAGEAGVPFLSVTGSDFMEMFVGVGASRVRDLFATARKMGRAIIFVDEIDSIGRKRGAGLGGGHDEREQTLNQMLAEMDGFEATEGIVMMAATNRPDILDPALLRPGRFDRQVVVPLPELEERVAVLTVHSKGKDIAPDVDLSVVARGTPGMSGADLSNLVNEAALHAVRNSRDQVAMVDFDYARDRMLMGQRRESLAMSDREKELTAYHEGGHALCAAVLPKADPVHKVTILPMGMALGVTMQLPTEDRHSYEQDFIEQRIVVAMGGRIAEKLVFGVSSSGAANDLMHATELATRMVREFGMSDRVGPMAWASDGEVFLGEELGQSRKYSDETARVIDEEVERILRDAEEWSQRILGEYRHSLDLIARALLEHETIDGAEVVRLTELGRPGGGGGGSPTVPTGDPGGQGGAAVPSNGTNESPSEQGSDTEVVAGSAIVGSTQADEASAPTEDDQPAEEQQPAWAHQRGVATDPPPA
ncbi:MAG TPA: ATP-dependent zinc metalloprotease FtsH [Acidimicrobiales bacterium]|nr:ATP-dependent zinc metalloprotease FtsH [Acidimicrobiales bacterium]